MKTIKLHKTTNKSLPYFIAVFILVLLLLSATGCNEKYDKETDLNITSWIKIERSDTATFYYSDVIIYGYYADTTRWTVESYENAKAGIITNIATGETKLPDFTSNLNEDKSHGLGLIPSGMLMLVACDLYGHAELESEMYGYRNIELPPGLAEMRIAVIFPAYETESKVSLGKWFMCNDNPRPTPAPEPEPEPEPEEGEDGEGDGDGDGEESGEVEGD